MSRSGGQLLADQLALHGVELAFCVPGESYLACSTGSTRTATALRVITCRHEAAAANAADAYGKLTGRPGVCMVTRGPGATHASTGVHTAMQDSTPLVLLVGQVPREHRGREAFQEIDYEQMFGRIAKWVFEIDRAGAHPRARRARVRRRPSRAGPGPVVLALPEDVLAEMTDAADAVPVPRAAAAPAPEALERMRELLAAAERPLAIVGGGGWTPQGADDVAAFLLGERHSGGGLVPLPGRGRQPSAGLLRRPRPRRQPGAGAARARGRRRARGRHAASRDRDRRLHAT